MATKSRYKERGRFIVDQTLVKPSRGSKSDLDGEREFSWGNDIFRLAENLLGIKSEFVTRPYERRSAIEHENKASRGAASLLGRRRDAFSTAEIF